MTKSLDTISLYVRRQATNPLRYMWEQFWLFLFGWIPTIVGIAIRGVVYRLILKMDGMAAIENNVRLRFASNIRLGKRVYLDYNVYIHACPNGVTIGDDTLVMHGSILHVYNFRGMKQSGIRIGKNSLIGEYNVIRGQGGVTHRRSRVHLAVRADRLGQSRLRRSERAVCRSGHHGGRHRDRR